MRAPLRGWGALWRPSEGPFASSNLLQSVRHDTRIATILYYLHYSESYPYERRHPVNHIETYLPHRPPFLFVDDAHIEGETIVATHTFHDDDWFFKGHFPSFPIVPGVLLVESMAQAGGAGAKLMGIYPKSLFMFAKIKEARFKRPVRPGDTLKMEILNVHASSVFLHQKGVGKVGDEIAVEAEWISISSGVPE